MRAVRDISLIENSISRQDLSYFLLGKKIYFVVNANAKSGNLTRTIRTLSKNFPLYSFNVILSSGTDMVTELTRGVLSADSLFIVMGGDGTVNRAVQYLTNTPAIIGVIPKGTANDLATQFGLPKDFKKALNIVSMGHITPIDTIKVNQNHILTIGSIGFPALIADRVNKFKSRGRLFKWIHRYFLRSSIYSFFVFASIFWERSRVLRYSADIDVDGKEVFAGDFVAVFFGKQEVLGKNFRACPGVSPGDPYFQLSVLKFQNLWQSLKDIIRISRGRSDSVQNLVCFPGNRFHIRSDRFLQLLGDGEILDYDDEFCGVRKDKAVNLITSQGKT